MAAKHEAHFENRTYYFTLLSKTDNEIRIEMYNTLYVISKSGNGWENHVNNRFNLNPRLITVLADTITKA